MIQVDHRRCGKDLDTWNKVICEAARNIGNYFYMLPTFAQGRKVIWEGKDNDGRQFLDYIPREMLDGRPKEDDMQIRIKGRLNGKRAFSIIQIVGSDNYDSLMGCNPRGIVLSEYALQNPSAWEFFRPMLTANGGWAFFPYTPRGKNHGYDLYETALKQIQEYQSERWYVQRLTINDTYDRIEDGKRIPIISKEDVENDLRSGMPQELIDQEYYCSFESGNVGSFFSEVFRYIDSHKRICDIPWNPDKPVDTFWDVGVTDDTTTWFVQEGPMQINVIDYYASSGKSIGQDIKKMHEKPYVYGKHYGPHDLEHSQKGTGTSTFETAKSLGFRFEVADRPSNLMDDIDAGRRMLLKVHFDRAKTKEGIKCLRSYHRKWDAKSKRFMNRPHHDWSSHAASAWAVLSTAWDSRLMMIKPKITIENEFSIYN